jgi:hypothetical protein
MPKGLRLLFCLVLGFAPGSAMLVAEETDALAYADLERPEHDYWNRTPKDPLHPDQRRPRVGPSRPRRNLGKGLPREPAEGAQDPASTQTLVYSTTSLQLRLISPRSPRAIYFNEEIYLGYVPGGKIEIVSIDPELGAIFYIFDIPKAGVRPVAERSQRCMNCHSDEDTREVPGIVIKSVVPGPSGGSLESYRRGLTGHEIPLSDRFGGWHVTGGDNLDKHWGNLTGRLSPEGMQTTPLPPGTQFDWSIFPWRRAMSSPISSTSTRPGL